MSRWRFTVAYTGELEAPTCGEAKEWAEESVEAGEWQPTTVDVERIAENEQAGHQD